VYNLGSCCNWVKLLPKPNYVCDILNIIIALLDIYLFECWFPKLNDRTKSITNFIFWKMHDFSIILSLPSSKYQQRYSILMELMLNLVSQCSVKHWALQCSKILSRRVFMKEDIFLKYLLNFRNQNHII
jgi:hypothetical protein